MIRHRPLGLGHPYRLELDQRVPSRPAANEAIELGATTGANVAVLEVELSVDGVRRVERLEPVDLGASTTSASDGHLAAAAAKLVGAGRRAWRLTLPGLPAGTPVEYRFRGGGSHTRRFEVTVAAWNTEGGSLRCGGADGVDRLVAGSVGWLQADAGPYRVRFALRIEPGAHVVGFGERFDLLDQAGKRLDTTVFEQYKGQGNRTYLPIPFAIVVPKDGPSGWGFHVRTTRRAWFDVAATEPDRLWIEVDLDPQERRPTVEIALYDGAPSSVLRSFLDEVGRPAVPPPWVFRPWMSGNEWNTQARVTAEVERSLAEAIPTGVVVIEAWSDEATFAAFRDARYEIHPDGSPHRLADFTFPLGGAWPDPKALVDWLHERDIRLLLWQVPLVPVRRSRPSQVRADRDTIVARGYGVREADGRPYRNRGWWFPGALLPDWTNPEAKAWWLEKRRYLVEELGVDGFKTDGGEHAWGGDLRYADGSRGDATNNRYPVQYAAAYQELLSSSGRDPVTFSRSGFTGSGAFPLHWAGDEDSTWLAYRASITAGLTAGASGIFFWGWDLAGFSGEIPDAELYLRSAAMACLCPIMQYHSEFNHHREPSRDRSPWNIAERTGDARVLPAYRKFAQLRERLNGYLSSQAQVSAERAVPLMRALFFEWPADPSIWAYPYQYMLGDDVLVAPVVVPGVAEWDVYLPAGDWVDAWRDTSIHGPAVVRVPAPLEEIPVFVRSTASPQMRRIFRSGLATVRRAGAG